MKPIRFFRHMACEGPGYFGTMLDRLQRPYEVICIDEGQAVPADLEGVAGLVFLGGPMSVNDQHGWINDELALIQKAQQRNLPMLGICLGSQLLSRALGGSVQQGGAGQEIGWHPLHKVENAASQAWLSGLNAEILAFHWHGETFTLPPNAELILGSACYPHQAYVCGKALALQFHVEMTADMVREWTGLYHADLAQGGDCNQDAMEITRDLEVRIARLHVLAEKLVGQWLAGLEEE
jgi:GMP synthase-like glutamine amidotransferase